MNPILESNKSSGLTNIQNHYTKLVFTAYYHLAIKNLKSPQQIYKDSMKPSLNNACPTIKSWMQSMVYQSPFVIKMNFQSQYTYTFILKNHTHVQCHSVSQTRASTKNATF